VSRIFRFYVGILAFLTLVASAAHAETCPVINLMPAYWQIVDNTGDQKAQFHTTLVTPNGDLYGSTGVGFETDAALDKAIAKSLDHARQARGTIEATEASLQRQLPHLIAQFQRSFPDFRCDFPIYLLPALGQLDGAGRQVKGQPALLLGVDVIADVHNAADTPVFIDHELFHRYHHQVAGMSDDDGERAPFWRAMWVEGLATYVSKTLTEASFSTALFDAGLVEQANAVFGDLIVEATIDYDKIDHDAYSRFFMGHKPGTLPPPRSGYYLGALAAEALAHRMSLVQLAHLTPDEAHEKLLTVLPTLKPAAGTD
jgi:hypothetical protein